jgi:hypothetical protein
MRSLVRAAASAVALLVLSSCTGTKMVQTWRDPQYQARPVNRIFIACFMPSDAARVTFENTLAQALLERGILSATSTGVFEYAPVDKEMALQFVKENKIDLVIVQRMMKETELAYMPGTVNSTVPDSPFWGSSSAWYGAYGYGGSAYTPGYMEEDTRVKTETTVYSAATDPGTLVWSGASSTINVRSAGDAAKSLQTELVTDLVKAGILVK